MNLSETLPSHNSSFLSFSFSPDYAVGQRKSTSKNPKSNRTVSSGLSSDFLRLLKLQLNNRINRTEVGLTLREQRQLDVPTRKKIRGTPFRLPSLLITVILWLETIVALRYNSDYHHLLEPLSFF